MLNASRIGEEAEIAALSLPLTREKVFESYYTYLTVDEPAVHLMPLHFLPTHRGNRSARARCASWPWRGSWSTRATAGSTSWSTTLVLRPPYPRHTGSTTP